MKGQITKAALLLLITAFASGCSDNEGAKRLLEKQGYTNVQTDGYAWLACSQKEDNIATKFTAVNPSGYTVSGAVCRGLWGKNSTIRFDD